LKAVYLRIAHQWSVLARSYEFADSAKHFLLDAKRTKDANSQQHSGELVHLPSSLASREAEHLLKRDSDRCCETTRPVPGGPPCAARSRSRRPLDCWPNRRVESSWRPSVAFDKR
jgi:hypothetical protein